MSVGGGEFENLGYISADGISLSVDEPDQEWNERLLAALSAPVTETIVLTVPWWQTNVEQRILLGRVVCGYSVPRLRRGKKGHKGKHWKMRHRGKRWKMMF